MGGSSGSGGAPGNGGGGATSTGGMKATGGSSATGGTPTGGAKSTGGAPSTGGMSTTGGTSTGGTTATGADQCKPIGWATRSGRTGGAFSVTGGGNATPIVVKTFADLKTYAADGQARVIHIDGTLGSGWSGNTGDRLEIKSNKTIIGLRPGTQLKAPIHINSASNVIVRNIVIRGPGSNDDQAWDNINIEGSSKNIWIDHCEFWDGQDGNADVVKGADTVTFTWNIFGYSLSGHSHNLSNLIASSDDEPESEGKLDITYMFNWWKAAAERKPRCRYGYIHVVNNLFTADTAVGPSNLGVTNGFSCNVLTENNHFIGEKTPIDLGKQAGTGSVQQAVGNLFESCSGNEKGSGTAFTPTYDYKSFMVPANQVKALVQKSAGATLANPTACN
jgi:pectate lyase